MADYTVSGKTLLDVCEIIVDCEHKTAPIQTTGYPSIRTPNVGRGRLILEDVNRVSEETYASWTRRAVPQSGDIILAREAPAGNVAVIPNGLKVCLGQRTVLIRADRNQADPHFLLYLLLDDNLNKRLLSFGSGATVPHVNMSDIRALALPDLPPLKTQAVIGSILSAYDDLIENNTRRIKILEKMAQMLYRDWFVHFRFPGHEHVRMVDSGVGKVPEGWGVGRLDDALLLQRGFDLPTGQRQEGTVPVYAATGIVGTHDTAKVKGPGVVTGRSGSLGTVIYIEEDYWPLNTTLWVKEFRRVTPLYAYYLISSLDFGAFNSGAAVPTLNRNDVHGLPVLIPPTSMLEAFGQNVISLNAMRTNLNTRNDKLHRTRDLLLPKLISGAVGT